MKKFNKWQLIGFAGMVLSFGANLLGNLAQEKQQEETIKNEVGKALAKKGL